MIGDYNDKLMVELNNICPPTATGICCVAAGCFYFATVSDAAVITSLTQSTTFW
jgi:hypothetical protein